MSIEIDGVLYGYDITKEEFDKMTEEEKEKVRQEHEAALSWVRKRTRDAQDWDDYVNSF